MFLLPHLLFLPQLPVDPRLGRIRCSKKKVALSHGAEQLSSDNGCRKMYAYFSSREGISGFQDHFEWWDVCFLVGLHLFTVIGFLITNAGSPCLLTAFFSPCLKLWQCKKQKTACNQSSHFFTTGVCRSHVIVISVFANQLETSRVNGEHRSKMLSCAHLRWQWFAQ